jgi:hypothetical protein
MAETPDLVIDLAPVHANVEGWRGDDSRFLLEFVEGPEGEEVGANVSDAVFAAQARPEADGEPITLTVDVDEADEGRVWVELPGADTADNTTHVVYGWDIEWVRNGKRKTLFQGEWPVPRDYTHD